jgi:cytoskeletal protein CcmA (bactofilin family)
MEESTKNLANPNGRLEAFLGKTTKIIGKVSFTGPVEVDGYIEGEIESTDKLVVGEGAQLNAKVSGGEVCVKGTVTGDIHASKKLSLLKTARVVGNVSCPNLSIEEGALLEGNCTMPMPESLMNQTTKSNDLRLIAGKAQSAK